MLHAEHMMVSMHARNAIEAPGRAPTCSGSSRPAVNPAEILPSVRCWHDTTTAASTP